MVDTFDGAIICVPGVVTVLPGEFDADGGCQEVESPADDDIVIKRHEKSYQNRTVSNTWKQREYRLASVGPGDRRDRDSPLNIGLIRQTEMGPCLWNWPRMSSM